VARLTDAHPDTLRTTYLPAVQDLVREGFLELS